MSWASFIGLQAWASDQAADALALAREFGLPIFFITMTLKPKWPEIVERLRPRQLDLIRDVTRMAIASTAFLNYSAIGRLSTAEAVSISDERKRKIVG
jgi:hypothetical protein